MQNYELKGTFILRIFTAYQEMLNFEFCILNPELFVIYFFLASKIFLPFPYPYLKSNVFELFAL